MNTILLILTLLLGTNSVCPRGTAERQIHDVGNRQSEEQLSCYMVPEVGQQFICILAPYPDDDPDDPLIVWAVKNPGYVYPAVVLKYTDGTSELQTYEPFAVFVTTPHRLHPEDFGVYVAGTGKELDTITWCGTRSYRAMLPITGVN